MAIVAPELGRHSWPVMATHDALSARLGELLGGALIDVIEHAGETTAVVQREALVPAITALRLTSSSTSSPTYVAPIIRTGLNASRS